MTMWFKAIFSFFLLMTPYKISVGVRILRSQSGALLKQISFMQNGAHKCRYAPSFTESDHTDATITGKYQTKSHHVFNHFSSKAF